MSSIQYLQFIIKNISLKHSTSDKTHAWDIFNKDNKIKTAYPKTLSLVASSNEKSREKAGHGVILSSKNNIIFLPSKNNMILTTESTGND